MAPIKPRILVPHPHVETDRKILGGRPYIRGSRVPVSRIHDLYNAGTPLEKIFRCYPQLSQAQILDALSFALDNPNYEGNDDGPVQSR